MRSLIIAASMMLCASATAQSEEANTSSTPEVPASEARVAEPVPVPEEKDDEKVVATIHTSSKGLHIRIPEFKHHEEKAGEGSEGKGDQGGKNEHDTHVERVDVGPTGVHVQMRHNGPVTGSRRVVHVEGPTAGSVLAGALGSLTLLGGAGALLVGGLALVADVVWMGYLLKNGEKLVKDNEPLPYLSTPLAAFAPLAMVVASGAVVTVVSMALLNRVRHQPWVREEEVPEA